MAKVDEVINALIDREGGYCNNPNDLGGETCWGVTVAEARQNGYLGNMEDMPRSFAFSLYVNKYWVRSGFSQIAKLNMEVGEELFDTGVNMGVGKAAEFLQVSLNALNRQGVDYPDIEEDHDVGPTTIRTFAAYLDRRGDRGVRVMLKALNCLQGARYIDISRKRNANEDFVFGWLDNRVSL